MSEVEETTSYSYTFKVTGEFTAEATVLDENEDDARSQVLDAIDVDGGSVSSIDIDLNLVKLTVDDCGELLKREDN